MRTHSLGYSEMERRDLYLPVHEAGCRCHAAARYDDLFWMKVGIGKWGRVSLRFLYELWDEGRTSLLATGFTQHATVNPAGDIVPVPSWLRRLGRHQS
jgi:acyl-CoA thioester hydrolase